MTTSVPVRLLALTAAVALSYLAWVLASGSGPGADTIFWAPGAVNGISVRDAPIMALWLAGVACCVGLVVPSRVPAWLPAVLLAMLLTFFALTLVKGDGPDSGPTVLVFASGYGVNEGDLPIVAVWLVGVAACAALGWRRRRL